MCNNTISQTLFFIIPPVKSYFLNLLGKIKVHLTNTNGQELLQSLDNVEIGMRVFALIYKSYNIHSHICPTINGCAKLLATNGERWHIFLPLWPGGLTGKAIELTRNFQNIKIQRLKKFLNVLISLASYK